MELPALTESAVSRRAVLGGIAAGAVTLVAGCSFGSSGGSKSKDSSGKNSSAADQKLTMALFAAVNSLDPHYVNAGSYISPCGLYEGLVATAPNARDVVPAIAEKWDVSDDGMTYTFHIRQSAKFSNGDPISAKDFVWTYQRLLTPTGAGGGGTSGANAYKPSLGIKGAKDYLAGTLTDWSTVGIKANDDQTLVITLDTPNSAFLLGMTNVSMLLLHPPTVQKYPKDWMQPAHWVGSGPYVLTSWNPTAGVSLKAHEHYWDRANVHIQQVDARVITDGNANLLAYRNNETQVAGANLALIGNDSTLLSQVHRANGYAVIFYQTMFSKHPASRDPRVREALAMAIDRDTLTKVVPGTQSGVSLVPDVVAGWDKSLAIPFDADRAKSLLAEAGYPGGKGMPTIQFLDYKRRPESDAVMDMLQSTLGISAKYNIVDLGQEDDIRYKPIDDPNMWGLYYTSFGGLPTWNNWVVDLWGPDVIPYFSLPADQAGQYLKVQGDKSLSGDAKTKKLAAIIDQYASADAKKFATDAAAAAVMTDEAKRTPAFVAAAGLRQQLGFQIPLLWSAHMFLAKPSVQGLHVNYMPNGLYLKGMSV